MTVHYEFMSITALWRSINFVLLLFLTLVIHDPGKAGTKSVSSQNRAGGFNCQEQGHGVEFQGPDHGV